MIKRKNGKWVLMSKTTGRMLGEHATKAEAVAQEMAIQMAKKKRKMM